MVSKVPLQLIYIYGTHFVIFYRHSSLIFILYFQYEIIFCWLIIQLSIHWEYPDTDITLVSEPTLPRASIDLRLVAKMFKFLEFRSLTSQWLLAIHIQSFSGKNWFLTKKSAFGHLNFIEEVLIPLQIWSKNEREKWRIKKKLSTKK